MSIREFSWKTAQGLKIYAAEWPHQQPQGVVGLIHGIGEHCRRYDEMGQALQAAGYAMIGYDRQGFGRSEGKRGFVEKFSYFYDEIAQLILECERKYPDLPVFLYGHSMGGNLLLSYLIRRKPQIAGAVASAPYISLPFKVNPITLNMGRLMRRVYPAFTVSNQVDNTLLSRSPGVGEAMLADPHSHDKVSSIVGIDMMKTAARLDEFEGRVTIPLLIMHGDADGLTSFSASEAFSNRVAAPSMEFKAWPGLYHELHNEPERQEVFTYVTNWLDRHLVDAERKLKSV
ncbi:MAG: lysophospholipase [Bacteroidota bacterium]